MEAMLREKALYQWLWPCTAGVWALRHLGSSGPWPPQEGASDRRDLECALAQINSGPKREHGAPVELCRLNWAPQDGCHPPVGEAKSDLVPYDFHPGSQLELSPGQFFWGLGPGIATRSLPPQLPVTYAQALKAQAPLRLPMAEGLRLPGLIEADVEILDVREAEEYAQEHLAEARLFPLSQLQAGRRPLREGRLYLLHCASGRRSARAAQLLMDEAYAVVDLGGLDPHCLGPRDAQNKVFR